MKCGRSLQARELEPSLDREEPAISSRLVTIPIAFDDFAMHSESLPYEDWERRVLTRASESDLTAVGMHDCYAAHWLAGYPNLLNRLRECGELKTLDEVAADVTLRNAA